MKEVSMYMAKDGQVFVTEKACLEHEQKQTVSSVVKELTAEMGNLGLFHHPIKRNEGHPVIYVDDLETFLIDKAKYIHHRIGGALIQEKKFSLKATPDHPIFCVRPPCQ